MQRIPTGLELSGDELLSMREIVARSFTPANQVGLQTRRRLMELGLIQNALGGVMATPAGRNVLRGEPLESAGSAAAFYTPLDHSASMVSSHRGSYGL